MYELFEKVAEEVSLTVRTAIRSWSHTARLCLIIVTVATVYVAVTWISSQ
jgi:hypothetical protein